MPGPDAAPPGVDPTKPAAARVYDYILGGSQNFEVDRLTVEKTRQGLPELEDIAWSNRGFHQRAARWLVAEAGIRQFLDIGSGLPTQRNTHEVVQEVNPDAQVVYVDIDPMVKAHAADLLHGSPHTTFITGDVREPDGILKNVQTRALLDFDQPIGLFMTGLLMLVDDDFDPRGLVTRYLDALVPGSYLALSHPTDDKQSPEVANRFRGVLGKGGNFNLRSRAYIENLFDGLELVPPYSGADPHITFAGLWGAEDPTEADSDGSRWMLAGLARKP
ncbi:SAM-dependent methyltransferase [Actinopolymorpha alba]|uniref:SAM-dependent methyltransferase n=1 Tax=Actinopolymorpha alba TaxID=533267 RepID=UPI00038022B9|nr:SAM-dependent methyltransferase [Actinopolymorpha alba]